MFSYVQRKPFTQTYRWFLGKFLANPQEHKVMGLNILREHAEFDGNHQNHNFNSEYENVHSKNGLQGCFKYYLQGPKTLPRWRAGPRRHRPKLLHWNLQLYGHQRDRQMGSYHERVIFLLHTLRNACECMHTWSEMKFSISTSYFILTVFLLGRT